MKYDDNPNEKIIKELEEHLKEYRQFIRYIFEY